MRTFTLNQITLYLLFLVTLAISCSDTSSDDLGLQPTDNQIVQGPRTQVAGTETSESTEEANSRVTDKNGLSDRVEIYNELVILEDDNTTRPATSKSLSKSLTPSNDVVWLHIADINGLTRNGEQLSATHSAIKDNYAFVSYHVRGEVHIGAFEVIDISDARLRLASCSARA